MFSFLTTHVAQLPPRHFNYASLEFPFFAAFNHCPLTICFMPPRKAWLCLFKPLATGKLKSAVSLTFLPNSSPWQNKPSSLSLPSYTTCSITLSSPSPPTGHATVCHCFWTGMLQAGHTLSEIPTENLTLVWYNRLLTNPFWLLVTSQCLQMFCFNIFHKWTSFSSTIS